MLGTSFRTIFSAALIAVGISGLAPAQVLYTENFDDGQAASRWTTSPSGNTNYSIDYGYDYVTAGIPLAPSGTGSYGLRMKATSSGGLNGSLMAFPTSQNFDGNHTLSFDLWMGVAGSTATTEFGIFGLNHSSTASQVPTSTSGTTPSVGPSPNGVDYALTGDSGASRDVRVYVSGTEKTYLSGGYASTYYNITTTTSTSGVVTSSTFNNQESQVAPYNFAYLSGTNTRPSNQWMKVSVTAWSGTTVFQVNGQTWARTTTETGTGNIMLGYMDIFSSISGTGIFGLYDNVSVTVARPPATNLTWTPNGVTAGGSGTWSNLGTQWIGTGTTPTTWDWSLPARFLGEGGIVTISGTQVTSGAGLEFLTDGYVLSSGTIILGSYTSPLNGSFNTNAVARVTVAAGASARIESIIRGTRGITKLGDGTLVLANVNPVSGTSVVQGGTLRLGNQSALASSPVNVVPGGTLAIDPALGMIGPRLLLNGGTISTSGGTLTVDRDLGVRQFIVNSGQLAGMPRLEVTLGGTMIMSGSTVASISVSALTIDESATGGRIDLGASRINVAAGGITPEKLVAAIIAGRSGTGVWTGTTGITSSVAAAAMATGGSPRAVGWADDGTGALSVAFAAVGDTNIDGGVDILDVANFLSAGKIDTGEPATWAQGDFNYDGIVDILDVGDFLSTGLYDAGSYLPAPAGLAPVTAVPEPATLGAAGVFGLVVAWRTRRRRAATTLPAGP